MIFRQLFDQVSGTYSYLLASRPGGEALIIDPVLEKVDRYLHLVRELDLKLVKAVDTHLHADHITGLGALRDKTHCITVMGEQTKADVVSMRLADGEKLTIEGLSLDAIYTPGHTDDSYSFIMPDRVFTGDTLLIRGTGRTDFQNGDPRAQYDSIFGRLLKLPEATLVYPAHDYKGDTVSTIGEEKAFNPRLQVKSINEYVELMNNLKLANPKMMDVAVPANMKVGLHQEEIARRGWAVTAAQALRRSYPFGCGTMRRYGFGAFQPCGYCFLASSSLTEPAMMTSSPFFQFTGVATLCLAGAVAASPLSPQTGRSVAGERLLAKSFCSRTYLSIIPPHEDACPCSWGRIPVAWNSRPVCRNRSATTSR
jgi:glyoxylase-like metal-dependent hydrolase (beta-lactamase superfamily II)